MKITAILHTHGVPEITQDTLQSIRHYMTEDVLVLIDGVGYKNFDKIDLPAYKLKGFNHGFYKAPYRNIVLGLSTAYRNFPNSDWFCYLEYDCLIGSASFKKDLLKAGEDGVWCLGNSYRRNQTANLSYLERIIKDKFEEVVYMLGACIFYHRNFLSAANEFFDKFLFHTNEFKDDFFPYYKEWDLSEHLLPTMVKYYGGDLREFAAYSEKTNTWSGNYRKYPIRFRPDLPYEEDYFLQACIMHPIKKLESPIREFHKARRQ